MYLIQQITVGENETYSNYQNLCILAHSLVAKDIMHVLTSVYPDWLKMCSICSRFLLPGCWASDLLERDHWLQRPVAQVHFWKSSSGTCDNSAYHCCLSSAQPFHSITIDPSVGQHPAWRQMKTCTLSWWSSCPWTHSWWRRWPGLKGRWWEGICWTSSSLWHSPCTGHLLARHWLASEVAHQHWIGTGNKVQQCSNQTWGFIRLLPLVHW